MSVQNVGNNCERKASPGTRSANSLSKMVELMMRHKSRKNGLTTDCDLLQLLCTTAMRPACRVKLVGERRRSRKSLRNL